MSIDRSAAWALGRGQRVASRVRWASRGPSPQSGPCDPRDAAHGHVHGASARAGQAILLGAKARALLAGRPAVVQTDVDACLLPALRHRVLLGFEADAEQVTVADLLP